ncbi:hypothetical protein GF362_02570 [Candidatus Dojkabacteria bacterium]|nr:hypothetical protein [Candidatus Dojkabacteria bacterium]
MQLNLETKTQLTQTPEKNLFSFDINGKEYVWDSGEMDRGLDIFNSQEYSYIATVLLGNGILKEQMRDNTKENLSILQKTAGELLQPYVNQSGKGEIFSDNPSIVMHFANRASAFYETDIQALKTGRRPGGYDIDIGDRAVTLTQKGNSERPGDLIIRRGLLLERQLKENKGVYLSEQNMNNEQVKIIDAGNLEYYHTSDALLLEALKKENGEESSLDLLCDFLSQNPNALIRVYASDIPTQILLLYLLQEVQKSNPEINKIRVEANSPEVSSLNRKDAMYPELGRLNQIPESIYKTLDINLNVLADLSQFELQNLFLTIKENQTQEITLNQLKESPTIENFSRLTPYQLNQIRQERYELLQIESYYSVLGQKGVYEEIKSQNNSFGLDVPIYAPGYSIIFNEEDNSQESKTSYINKVLKAQRRLKDMYGLPMCCFKWSTASDGKNTFPRIPNTSEGEKIIAELAEKAWDAGQSSVIATNSFYEKSQDQYQSDLTPSAHILGGYALEDIITSQTVRDQRWVGNSTMTKADFIKLAGQDQTKRNKFENYFETILSTQRALADALREDGIALAGNDFGIYEAGGIFFDDTFVTIQDNNWRFTGANLAHASYELAKKQLNSQNISTVTRVIDITEKGNYENIREFLDDINYQYSDYAFSDIVTITPGWSMISLSCKNPTSVTYEMMEFIEQELVKQGLIQG